MNLPHYNDNDRKLAELLGSVSLTNPETVLSIREDSRIRRLPVHFPDDGYGFLHETAGISFHGSLFAAWYNCPLNELSGRTPIRWTRSKDGGLTWDAVRCAADDPSGKLLYCPPVFGICGDRLYLLMNEMVSADHIHALDLYRWNEETEDFDFLWSKPIPFKLNTNVVPMPDGKLLLAGRIAEMDGFPNTPAVLISDSGEIDGDWRLVKVQENGGLPDGSKLIHPETCPIVQGKTVWLFCRDDERNVPLLYRSDDGGESWSDPVAHDIPFSGSKIYAGTLSDGRNFVIGNLYPGRSRLAAFFTKPGCMTFERAMLLYDGKCAQFPDCCGSQWSYPVAWEDGGNLYVIHTATVEEPVRGAAMAVIPLSIL